MTYKKIIPGLVIEIPHNQEHHGVILQSIALSKGWYKVTVLCDYEDVLVLKLKYKADGKHFFYRCLHDFDTRNIVEMLNLRQYVQGI